MVPYMLPLLPMLQPHCHAYQDCIRIALRFVILVFTSIESHASMLLWWILLWPFCLWGVIVKSMKNDFILYKSLLYAVSLCTQSLPGCGSLKNPTFIHYKNPVILVLNFRQKGSDNFHTSLGPQGLSVKKGFVFISDLVGPEECWVIGSMVGTSVFHVFTVYSGVWPCFSHTKLPSMWCPIFCRLVLVLKLQEGRQEILLVLNLRKAVLDLHGVPTPSRMISWTRSRINHIQDHIRDHIQDHIQDYIQYYIQDHLLHPGLLPGLLLAYIS